jgi:hypothetical protein
MAVDLAVPDAAPATTTRGLGRALGVAALVAVLVVGIGLTAAGRLSRHDAARSPASPLYLAWPARGSLRDDSAAVAHAQHVWDYFGAPEREGPLNPHTDVRVLYAGHLDVGDLFVLQATTTRTGLPEIGFIFLPPHPDHYWVPEGVEDIAMPAPQLTTHLVVLTLTNMAGDDQRLVVIGQPGTTTIGYSTVPDPDTVLPMYVEDGIGTAPFGNTGIQQVVLADANGTYYQGRSDVITVNDFGVGYQPPQ